MMSEDTIAKYEDRGFRRWTKGRFDRLYINVKDLGAKIDYYGTGNVSSAYWQGERVSNADGRRLLASKVFVDVKTGELSVTTKFEPHYTNEVQVTVEDAARDLIASI
jgi:hypothetical protein